MSRLGGRSIDDLIAESRRLIGLASTLLDDPVVPFRPETPEEISARVLAEFEGVELPGQEAASEDFLATLARNEEIRQGLEQERQISEARQEEVRLLQEQRDREEVRDQLFQPFIGNPEQRSLFLQGSDEALATADLERARRSDIENVIEGRRHLAEFTGGTFDEEAERARLEFATGDEVQAALGELGRATEDAQRTQFQEDLNAVPGLAPFLRGGSDFLRGAANLIPGVDVPTETERLAEIAGVPAGFAERPDDPNLSFLQSLAEPEFLTESVPRFIGEVVAAGPFVGPAVRGTGALAGAAGLGRTATAAAEGAAGLTAFELPRISEAADEEGFSGAVDQTVEAMALGAGFGVGIRAIGGLLKRLFRRAPQEAQDLLSRLQAGGDVRAIEAEAQASMARLEQAAEAGVPVQVAGQTARRGQVAETGQPIARRAQAEAAKTQAPTAGERLLAFRESGEAALEQQAARTAQQARVGREAVEGRAERRALEAFEPRVEQQRLQNESVDRLLRQGLITEREAAALRARGLKGLERVPEQPSTIKIAPTQEEAAAVQVGGRLTPSEITAAQKRAAARSPGEQVPPQKTPVSPSPAAVALLKPGAPAATPQKVAQATKDVIEGGSGLPREMVAMVGGVDTSTGAARRALAATRKVATGTGKVAKGTTLQAKRLLDAYGTQFIEHIERQAITVGPLAKVVGRKARHHAADVREILGRLEPLKFQTETELGARGLPRLTKAGRGRQKALRQARKDLQKTTKGKEDPRAEYARIVGVIEEFEPVLNQTEKKLAQNYRKWLKETGKIAEESGVKRLRGSEVEEFIKATRQNRFIRVPTPDMFVITQRGGKMLDDLSEIIAKENGLTKVRVQETLKELFDPKSIRTLGMIERGRLLPKFPTHATLDGRRIQLLETDPVRIVTAGNETFANRVAFIKNFGQEFAEQGTTGLAKLQRRWANAGGNTKDLDNLFRFMNNRPTSYALERGLQVGEHPYLRMAAVDIFAPVFRGFGLTASSIVNIPELIMKVPAHVGTKNLIKAALQIARHPFKQVKQQELRALGAMNTEVLDFILGPGRAARDIGKLIQGSIVRLSGTQYVNEFNEAVSAQAGRLFAEQLISKGKLGKFSKLDRLRARIARFGEREIDLIATGKATLKEQQRFIQEMAARTSGFTQGTGTLTRAERSLAANTPWFRAAVWYQNYMMTTVAELGRFNRILGKAIATGSPVEKAQAFRLLGQLYAGQTAGGAAAIALSALAFGQVADFGESKWDAIKKSAWESGMSGPIRSFSFIDPSEGAGRAAARILPAGRVIENVWDWGFDQGRFMEKDGGEGVAEFLAAQVPGVKIFTGGLMTFLGHNDPQIRDATRRYWNWMKENKQTRNIPPADGKFAKLRRDTVGHLKGGREKEAIETLREALAVGAEERAEELRLEGIGPLKADQKIGVAAKTMVASLKSRRLLPRVPKLLLEKMRKELGPERMELLERHDQMLMDFIKIVARETKLERFLAKGKEARKAG